MVPMRRQDSIAIWTSTSAFLHGAKAARHLLRGKLWSHVVQSGMLGISSAPNAAIRLILAHLSLRRTGMRGVSIAIRTDIAPNARAVESQSRIRLLRHWEASGIWAAFAVW